MTNEKLLQLEKSYFKCTKKQNFENVKILLEYITNLQEENEILKDKLDIFMYNNHFKQETIDNLRKRIDSALNYIKSHKSWWEEWHYDMCGVDDDIEEIIKILEGEKNE